MSFLPSLKVGDVVRTPSIVSHHDNGPLVDAARLTFKAPKGVRFLFLFIGTSDSKATAEERLNALGWHFAEEEGGR